MRLTIGINESLLLKWQSFQYFVYSAFVVVATSSGFLCIAFLIPRQLFKNRVLCLHPNGSDDIKT